MAKEKSITELKDERNQLIARSKEIINGAKTEKRQFKPEEAEEIKKKLMDAGASVEIK